MIKIFKPTDREFSSNGDIVVNPLRAVVTKVDNGEYYLELVTDLSYVDFLVQGNIVVANTPQGEQAFRLDNPSKTGSKITVRANHVFYDTENYVIADSYVVDKNCNDALDHLNMATDSESPFTTISDIQTINTYRCVRKSLYEAINTVVERWGGHLVRDNFRIGIMNQIGADNGVTVRFRKNLKEISAVENWDNVVTKLMPVGYDGTLLNSVDKTLEPYVYSENSYDIPYTKVIEFTQDIDSEQFRDDNGELDEDAYKLALIEDLRVQATNYVNSYDEPEVSYTLKANLEKITDVGDTVEVIDERLGLSLITNVTSFSYDCILGKYTELVFGNTTNTLKNLISNITAQAEKITDEKVQATRVTLSQELMTATDRIWSAMSDSYVIYEGDKVLIVDSLPKETANNVIMINSGGIGFSNTGIHGQFSSAWTIDGTLNMSAINVINLTADLIKGGTLKLGSKLNESGILEIYDDANNLIGVMDKSGLKMYGNDGSYVLLNNEVGFAGYDRNGNKIYWVSQDEFHMKKSVIEEEITLCNELRFIAVTLTDSEGSVVNDGIALVSALGGAS